MTRARAQKLATSAGVVLLFVLVASLAARGRDLAALQALLPSADLGDLGVWWLVATRNAVALVLATTLVAGAFGLALGAVSVYGGAGAAGLLARLVEFSGAIPGLILVGLLRAIDTSGGALALFWALAALRSLEVAQLVRAHVLTTLPSEFVEASRALGASRRWQLRAHVLPRLMRPLAVNLLAGAASTIGLEAALTFVGLGFPPSMPSWGGGLAAIARGASASAWLCTLASIGTASAALYLLGARTARESTPSPGSPWRARSPELNDPNEASTGNREGLRDRGSGQ